MSKITIDEFTDMIKSERKHQADRWGDGTEESLDKTDDRENSPMEFVGYIVQYSTKWFTGGFKPWNVATLRQFQVCMIKVATLAYSAMIWADRAKKKLIAEGDDS